MNFSKKRVTLLGGIFAFILSLFGGFVSATDPENFGFDIDGYNKFTKTYYDFRGFNCKNIHKQTNTKYDVYGYDVDGYNEAGVFNYSIGKYCFGNNGCNHRGVTLKAIIESIKSEKVYRGAIVI